MKRLYRQSALVTIVLVVLISTALLPAMPVIAATSLQIKSGIVLRDVRPGEAFEHIFTVQSNPNDPDLEMTVEAAGFGQAPDGSYQALTAAEDTSSRSARTFITGIDKPSFILKPGPSGAQKVNVSIKVPQNVTPGGYYAIIYVHSQPAGEGLVGVILAANIPVVLTVKGADRTTTGEITAVEVGEIISGQPIKVATTFKNTGNYHFKASNRITITDGDGNQVAEVLVPLTGASIIPGYAYRFDTSLAIAGGLGEGEYRVASEINVEDGAVLDEYVRNILYRPVLPTKPIGLTVFSDLPTVTELQIKKSYNIPMFPRFYSIPYFWALLIQ